MFLCYVPFSSLLSDFFCLTRARAVLSLFFPLRGVVFSRVRFNWEQNAVCKNKHISGMGSTNRKIFSMNSRTGEKKKKTERRKFVGGKSRRVGPARTSVFPYKQNSEFVSTQRQNLFAGRFSEAFGERAKSDPEECRFCARFLFSPHNDEDFSIRYLFSLLPSSSSRNLARCHELAMDACSWFALLSSARCAACSCIITWHPILIGVKLRLVVEQSTKRRVKSHEDAVLLLRLRTDEKSANHDNAGLDIWPWTSCLYSKVFFSSSLFLFSRFSIRKTFFSALCVELRARYCRSGEVEMM